MKPMSMTSFLLDQSPMPHELKSFMYFELVIDLDPERVFIIHRLFMVLILHTTIEFLLFFFGLFFLNFFGRSGYVSLCCPNST